MTMVQMNVFALVPCYCRLYQTIRAMIGVLVLSIITKPTQGAIEKHYRVSLAVHTSTADNSDSTSEIQARFFLPIEKKFTARSVVSVGADEGEIILLISYFDVIPNRVELCNGNPNDDWTYTRVTINALPIDTTTTTLDDSDACAEYDIESGTSIPFPLATGYSTVQAVTGGGGKDGTGLASTIYFDTTTTNPLYYGTFLEDGASPKHDVVKTYYFIQGELPDQVTFCLVAPEGTDIDNWKLRNVYLNGKKVRGADINKKNPCKTFKMTGYTPILFSEAPTSSPTRFPTPTPTFFPTSRPTAVPTPVPLCRCQVVWDSDRCDGGSSDQQTGCPTTPCDADAGGAWCLVRRTPCVSQETSAGGGWAYCNPLETEPPTFSPITSIPTVSPSNMPTLLPSKNPTRAPSVVPTVFPTYFPSVLPTPMPTGQPTTDPCEIYPCALLCEGECAWHYNQQKCITGPLVGQQVKPGRAGVCPIATTITSTTIAITNAPNTASITQAPGPPTTPSSVTAAPTTAGGTTITNPQSSGGSTMLIVIVVVAITVVIICCFVVYIICSRRQKEKHSTPNFGFMSPNADYNDGSGYIDVNRNTLSPIARVGQFVNPAYEIPQPVDEGLYGDTPLAPPRHTKIDEGGDEDMDAFYAEPEETDDEVVGHEQLYDMAAQK